MTALLVQPGSRVLLCLLALVACLTGATPARADTVLDGGPLVLEASGRWRTQKSPHAFSASGFVGVKRSTLHGIVYDGITSPADAWINWRKWRERVGGDLAFTQVEKGWMVHEKAKGEVYYVHTLAARGQAAAVWLVMSGEPGVVQDDAFELLSKAKFRAPKVEEPAAGGAKEPAGGDRKVVKDRDFAVSLSVPASFEERKDVETDSRRVLSLVGEIGSDDEAYLDLYAFPDFDREEAVGWWWIETERRKWRQPLTVEGEPPSFKLLLTGETWTRHVRILPTKAGIYGVKLDVASQAEAKALELLDSLVEGAGLTVLKPRPAEPSVPHGFKPVSGLAADAPLIVFAQNPGTAAAVAAKAIEADAVVERVLRLEPWEGARGELWVFADRAALDAGIKSAGGEPGSDAQWLPLRRAVFTHSDVLETKAGSDRLAFEIGRAGASRRLGFRAPFWIEYGIGGVVEGGSANRGRLDRPNPRYMQGALDASGGSIDFEPVRWWPEEESAGNPEREAVSWGLCFFFLQSGSGGKKWHPTFASYLETLRRTCRQSEASKVFDFSREGEFIEEWKRFIRKL